MVTRARVADVEVAAGVAADVVDRGEDVTGRAAHLLEDIDLRRPGVARRKQPEGRPESLSATWQLRVHLEVAVGLRERPLGVQLPRYVGGVAEVLQVLRRRGRCRDGHNPILI